jgi:toxin ParE1/3/4
VTHCESLASFPHRGMRRDDTRRGLCITQYAKRAVIAFAVGEKTVSIIGVYYGGQDYETALKPDLEGLTLHEPRQAYGGWVDE